MGGESNQRVVTAERDRCAHILVSAIDRAPAVTAIDLLAAVDLIKTREPGDPRAAAEQSRCVRIIEAASYHLQGHEAAAQHALAAIRLSRHRRFVADQKP